MPALILLMVFIGVPVLEIAVFIEVGGRIGLAWTLVIVVATAIAGSALLRLQGLATLRRAQESLARNELPLREVFDGMCLVFAGALLLTPGFVTDTVGGLLFLPPVRFFLRVVVSNWFMKNTIQHSSGRDDKNRPGGGSPPDDDGVIEGEWEDLSERDRIRLDHDRDHPTR